MSNFKHEIRNGSYHKVCVHCGAAVSTGASGKEQMSFTLRHAVKHAGPAIVEIPAAHVKTKAEHDAEHDARNAHKGTQG